MQIGGHYLLTKVVSRWEQDYKLQAWDQMSLFDEYLEMVIQVMGPIILTEKAILLCG